MSEKKIRMFEVEIFYCVEHSVGTRPSTFHRDTKYYIVGSNEDDAKWWAIEHLRSECGENNGYSDFFVKYCNVNCYPVISRIVATDMTDNVLF